MGEPRPLFWILPTRWAISSVRIACRASFAVLSHSFLAMDLASCLIIQEEIAEMTYSTPPLPACISKHRTTHFISRSPRHRLHTLGVHLDYSCKLKLITRPYFKKLLSLTMNRTLTSTTSTCCNSKENAVLLNTLIKR